MLWNLKTKTNEALRAEPEFAVRLTRDEFLSVVENHQVGEFCDGFLVDKHEIVTTTRNLATGEVTSFNFFRKFYCPIFFEWRYASGKIWHPYRWNGFPFQLKLGPQAKWFERHKKSQSPRVYAGVRVQEPIEAAVFASYFEYRLPKGFFDRYAKADNPMIEQPEIRVNYC